MTDDDAKNSGNKADIIPNKSLSDDRHYKIITLPNKLECILISDPETEKAACAVAVRVGHFADPDYLPGLAHFLEHMLFLGTKKYPNEAEYMQFLKDHGGRCNASTSTHDTCFQFDVGSEHLEAAVDRFAQFFMDPLFTESATDRELNAVNSENSKNLQSDLHRFYQFDKSLSKASHPFHKFGTGNLETLKDGVDKSIDLRQELLSFYDRFYSSSVMKLAIYGKEDLDALHALVRDKFSGVANKETVPPQYSQDVYEQTQFPVLHKLVPIEEQRGLRLKWMMPSCYDQDLVKPTALLSYCFNDESPGSILSYLKELGLATAMGGDLNYNLPEFCLMAVVVLLTPDGLARYDEIVEIVYRYIAKMRALTDEQWRAYHTERYNVGRMDWNFKGKGKAYSYCARLARNLQRNFPRQQFLELSYMPLLFDFDAERIRKYLGYLSVDNCYYQLIAKEFEAECDQKEQWYSTLYKSEKVSDEFLQRWRAPPASEIVDPRLFTPLLNKYIADDFTILAGDNDTGSDESKSEDAEGKSLPYVIRETDESKIWFKQDREFKKPKLCMRVRVHSPLLNGDTLSMTLTDLVINIFNDELSDSTWKFQQASLDYVASYSSSYQLFNGSNAIEFLFSGYNQKLHLLVETVLSKFKNLVISKEKFEINKEKYARQVQSVKKTQPYGHCGIVCTLFLCDKSVSFKDMDDALAKITYEGVVKQYERIFDKMYVEALFYGNIDQSTVHPYCELLDKYLIQCMKQKYTAKELENDRVGCLKLASKSNFCVSFKCPNEADANSCILTNFMFKADTVKDFAPLRLFVHLCTVPCFAQLRTKEQLGYIVWSYQRTTRGFLSFRVVVQSTVANPNKLNSRVEAFLKSFRAHIAQMSDGTFELNKRSVINTLLEKTKSIYEQNERYWTEIETARFQFSRNEKVAAEITKVTKKDVLAFYDAYISIEGEQRAKLTVQCYGNKHALSLDDEAGKNDPEWRFKDDGVVEWNVDDVAKVRDECGFYPFPYISGSIKL